MNNLSIKTIAELAGVSTATVSRVINRTAEVREDTRNRVLKVIAEQQYKPNQFARGLSNNTKPNNIALLVPDVANPFFTDVLKGITQRADQLGYNVFLFVTDETPEREHRFLESMRQQMIQGIIMVPVSEHDVTTEYLLLELSRSGIPLVLLDRCIGDNQQFDGVFTDDDYAAEQVTNILIAEGHTKIATISGPARSASGQARYIGYSRALQNHGLPVLKEYNVSGEFRFEQGYEAAETLMNLANRPTAIFSTNNMSTIGALSYFADHDIEVGKDVSIIGFDELENCLMISPRQKQIQRLSFVERPVKAMAAEAVELLQRHILYPVCKDQPYINRRVVLHNQIVLRGSEKLEGLKKETTPVV